MDSIQSAYIFISYDCLACFYDIDKGFMLGKIGELQGIIPQLFSVCNGLILLLYGREGVGKRSGKSGK